jgi:lysophospholipase L1-like esterase
MYTMRFTRRLLVLSAVVLFCASSAPASAAEAPSITLKKGDRIVFLGDSITEAGAAKKGYITRIKETIGKKQPDLGIDIVGAGISGNKVPDLQRRVDRDVVAKKPSIVFIYIGINDVWHGESDPKRGTSPEKFEAGLKEVIGKIVAGGARVILCTPTVIGEKKNGKNRNDKKLDEFAAISRAVAKELKLPLCDLRKAFIHYLKDHNPKDAERDVLTTDGVHLNDAGNKLVAETMLKMLGKG